MSLLCCLLRLLDDGIVGVAGSSHSALDNEGKTVLTIELDDPWGVLS